MRLSDWITLGFFAALVAAVIFGKRKGQRARSASLAIARSAGYADGHAAALASSAASIDFRGAVFGDSTGHRLGLAAGADDGRPGIVATYARGLDRGLSDDDDGAQGAAHSPARLHAPPDYGRGDGAVRGGLASGTASTDDRPEVWERRRPVSSSGAPRVSAAGTLRNSVVHRALVGGSAPDLADALRVAGFTEAERAEIVRYRRLLDLIEAEDASPDDDPDVPTGLHGLGTVRRGRGAADAGRVGGVLSRLHTGSRPVGRERLSVGTRGGIDGRNAADGDEAVTGA